VRPKWFLCLWYVRRKPCTYLASSLAASPYGPSFHLSLISWEYHQVCPKWFLSWWYVWCKLCTYLAPTLTLSPNRKKRDSHDWHHLWVPSGASKMISEPMVCSAQTVHQSCFKISTISRRTELSLEPRHLGVPSGASKMIFWANGMFVVNSAPILH
jgi:hypothetical protein